MILSHQKDLFHLPQDICYLDMASQSPSFISVEEAGIAGVLQKSHPHTITKDDYFEPIKTLKQLFASLIGIEDYNRIANLPSVSYGMATLAKNSRIQKNEEILLIGNQFPSNYYAWERLVKSNGGKLKIVHMPKTSENRGQKWNEDILEAISDKTAIVAMGAIHWTNGTLFDLKSIRNKTKKHNSLLFIDGSQSVGALPFSVKDIQPDALICAGYKWLFGPYGCAYGYFSPVFDNGLPIEENWTNRLGSENMQNLSKYQDQYKPLANRYSVGEHASFIHTKMQIAALQELVKFPPQHIQDYCKEICRDALPILKELGCYIENDDFRANHLFGVELPEDLDKGKLKKTLSQKKIFISFRDNYIRISCHIFNTSNDLLRLTDSIKSCL